MAESAKFVAQQQKFLFRRIGSGPCRNHKTKQQAQRDGNVIPLFFPGAQFFRTSYG